MSQVISGRALALSAFVALLIPQTVWAACGEVLVSKGDIKIESGAGGKVSAAPVGTKVCQGDTVIAGAQSRAKVKMEDGNELNISPDSRIKLETYEYKASDNKKKVMLNVLYGKVRAATREENMYNDKAKDGQANTFQVKTKSAVAGVRGTDFLTSFDRKTTKTEVVTFRGTVEVGTLSASGTILNAVKVGAGQKTEMLPGAAPAPPKEVPKKEIESIGSDSNASTGGKKSSSMISHTELGTTDTSRSPASDTKAPSAIPVPPTTTAAPVIPVLPPTPPTPPPTPPPTGAGRVKVIIDVPRTAPTPTPQKP